MITKMKTTIWAIALLFSVGSVLVLSSCGDDEEPAPPPDPVVAPGLSYAATTVAVGTEGSVTAAVTGDAATYEITDLGNTVDKEGNVIVAVTVDANTGELSIAKESTIGVYTVEVTATNSAGTDDATAEITIGINEAFDPRGKSLEWKLFMNQTENLELVGLDGVPDLPISSLVLPVGWPDASTPAEEVWTYGVMTGVQGLLVQVPGDEACTGSGDSKKLSIAEDLSVSVICSEGEPAVVGSSTISFKDDKFVYTLELEFQPGLAIPYEIDDARFEEFQDGYTDPANPVAYPALLGTVIGMVTPTNLATEETIQDFTSWAYPNVDVVLEDITE